MTKKTNFYLDNLIRNAIRVDQGLPMLLPKKINTSKTQKSARNNKSVINLNIDPLPEAPPPRLPGVDWDLLQKDNEPKKSSGLNYLMGVDDE